MKRVRKYFISLVCLFLSGLTFAQSDTYFWFVVPEVSTTSSSNGDRPISLTFTTGSSLAYVTISQPANPSFTPIIQGIPANYSTTVNLTPYIDSLENKPANSILNRGLLITSTAPVSAYYEVNGTGNGEIFTLKGRQALGNQFFIPAEDQYDNNSTITPVANNSFDIVATQDNTVVTIKPSQNITGHSGSVSFIVTLNKGQTYSAVATSQVGNQHLAGSTVSSTKPIAITVKDDYIKPSFGTGNDLEGDQIVPTILAGKNFVAIKGLLSSDDHVYIIATKNNTAVYINGSSTPMTTLIAGTIFPYTLSTAVVYIRTSENAYLWHETGSGSDVAATMLPEIGCTGSRSISAFRTSSGSLYAMLITNVANIGGFKVNGTYTVPSSSFSSVPGYTNIQYARIDLSSIVPQGDTVHITNTVGLFQGGILQSGSTGTKYSFFSGYSNSYIGPDIQLCSGDAVELDGGADKNTYLWSNSASTRKITVSSPGIYWVTTTQGTCTLYDTIIISSFPKPTAGFNRTGDTIKCLIGNSFTFQNTSTISSGSMSYLWKFGDNTTSTSINPTHSYTHSGIFNVKLIAKSIDGCMDSIMKKVYVRLSATIAFSINDTLQCLSGNNFAFTNSSFLFPSPLGGTIAAYLWRFGDGTTSTQTSPIHLYSTAGTYNVWLTVITTFGCRDSISKTVYVNATPISLFSTPDTSQCLTGNTFDFISTSSVGSGYLTSQEWDFGDMSVDSGNSVTHSYSGTGNYIVKLTVTSNLGCTDSLKKTMHVLQNPHASFTINDTSQCLLGNSFRFINNSTPFPGSTLLWDFGDSTTSTMPLPVHSYNTLNIKNVKLVVTSGICRDSLTRQVVVNVSPHASFNTNDTIQCFNTNIFILTNTSTYSGFGFLHYLWVDGDGDSAITKNNKHTYRQNGIFVMKMLAISDSGCTDSVKHTMTVDENPTASFTVGATGIDTIQCLDGNSFSFNNTSTGGVGDTYLWKFGDNTTSTDKFPTHSFLVAGTFSVKLIVRNTKGCLDSIMRDIYVVAKPISSFTVNDTTQCLSTNDFVFTNTSTGTNIRRQEWQFGDGNFAGTPNTKYTYSNAGTFVVSLMVELNSGCADTSSRTMIVYAMPRARFSVNDTIKCFNTNMHEFTDLSTNPGTSLTWLWKFGDGITLTLQNPKHNYLKMGTYVPTLIITNNNGCIDSTKLTIVVAPYPLAAFKNYDSIQCFDRNLFHFTNTSQILFGSMSYLWNFGDGDTSTSINPTHHYSIIDTFKVRLIATSNYGCIDSFSWHTFLHSGARPVAAFTVNDSTQCLTGNNFIFTNGSTISSGNISTEIWNFGDGDTSHKHDISHIYKIAGITTAKLLVISDQNCIDSVMHTMSVDPKPKAAFTVNDSTQCINANKFKYINRTTITSGTFNILWNFDDGSTSTIDSPEHSYTQIKTYNVKLIAVSNQGCKDSVTHKSIINPLPVSAFDITTDTLQCLTGNLFSFTDKSTMSNGSISMNLWRFGDGGYATSTPTASHTYTKDGTFIVKLINITDNMCYDTVQKLVYVIKGPTLAFTVNDSAQCLSGNKFVFTNNTTSPSGTLTYLWKFGDGATSTDVNPNHSYASQATYKVTLIATSSIGCIDSMSKIMSVFDRPVTNFTINDTDQCFKGNLFEFTNTTTPIMPGINFLWNFGDGNTSTAINPSYSYPVVGNYTVKLKTVTSQGCDDSISKKVYVIPSQQTSFSINDTAQCFGGNMFILTNTSTISIGTLTYLWKLGDGDTSNLTDLSHPYISSGKYTVKLISISNNNCKDSVIHDVYVDAGPKADFNVIDSSQCLTGNNFIFINSSVSGGTVISGYVWDFGDGNTSSATSPSHSYLTSDTFNVKLLANTSGGCNDSIIKQVFVRPMPTADFSINLNPQDIVGNNFVFTNLSVVPYGNLSSFWSFGDGNTSINPNPSYNYSVVDTYSVRLTITSDYGCIDTISKLVYLTTSAQPLLTVDFTFKNACVGDSVVFENKSTISPTDSFQNFFWEFGDTTQTIIRNNPKHSYRYSGTYVVKMRGVSWGGLEDSVSYNVTINPKPDLTITFALDTVAYLGNKVTLTGTGIFDIINWSTGEQTVSILVEKTGTYSAKVVNNYGCYDSASISIRFKDPVDFVVMTIITPNGDGFNDFWKVENIDRYQPCKVSIYNRWGDLLYTVSDYKNDWDGKYKGKILPEGTYYFVLESRDKKIYKGAVNILK